MRSALSCQTVSAGLARRTRRTWISLICWFPRRPNWSHYSLRTLVTLTPWRTFGAVGTKRAAFTLFSRQPRGAATSWKTL